jgi:hypothetical protein
MNLLEQVTTSILQQLVDPFFEPVIINNHLLTAFCSFVSDLNVDKSNMRLLRRTRNSLLNLQANDSVSVIFRANVIKCLDVLLLILQANEDAIVRWKKRNQITTTRMEAENESSKTEYENTISRMESEIEILKHRKPVIRLNPTVIGFELTR